MAGKRVDLFKHDRGLGDTVARAIHKVTGIEPCGGCKDRQEKLNRVVPYDPFHRNGPDKDGGNNGS